MCLTILNKSGYASTTIRRELDTDAYNDYTSAQEFLKSIAHEQSQTQRLQVYQFVHITFREGEEIYDEHVCLRC